MAISQFFEAYTRRQRWRWAGATRRQLTFSTHSVHVLWRPFFTYLVMLEFIRSVLSCSALKSQSQVSDSLWSSSLTHRLWDDDALPFCMLISFHFHSKDSLCMLLLCCRWKSITLPNHFCQHTTYTTQTQWWCDGRKKSSNEHSLTREPFRICMRHYVLCSRRVYVFSFIFKIYTKGRWHRALFGEESWALFGCVMWCVESE